MVKKILIAIVVLVAGFAGYVALQPPERTRRALRHHRRPAVRRLSARQRAQGLGCLVALGQTRSQRQDDVRRTAQSATAPYSAGPETTTSARAR